MSTLRAHIREIPDFPQAGVVFRDITPLLRQHFDATIAELSSLLAAGDWQRIDAVAGIEARGFILAAALANHHGKGFVSVRKAGKLPPPVVRTSYALEYGTSSLEMQRGSGRLVIIDDVLATGGTMQAAADLATEAGYQVMSLLALIDLHLNPTFEWHGIRVQSAIKYSDRAER
jgi:adenine phosphoribosyltransferase